MHRRVAIISHVSICLIHALYSGRVFIRRRETQTLISMYGL